MKVQVVERPRTDEKIALRKSHFKDMRKYQVLLCIYIGLLRLMRACAELCCGMSVLFVLRTRFSALRRGRNRLDEHILQ